MDANDSKIKVLTENNDELTRELETKTRSLLEAQDQVKRLKDEKKK